MAETKKQRQQAELDDKKPESTEGASTEPSTDPDPAPEAPEDSGENTETFTRDEVVANGPAIAGYPSYVVAGALTLSDEESFTRESAAELTKKFVESPTEER